MFKIVLEHRTKSEENTAKLVELIKEIRVLASQQPGFMYGETLVDVEDKTHVIVISTWKRQEDWKNWDESQIRALTKPRIEELLVVPYNALALQVPIVWREDMINVF